MIIGHDQARDRARFHVTEGGVVVIPKGMKLEGLIE
jgi:ADP-glucose pyrophosphorylase